MEVRVHARNVRLDDDYRQTAVAKIERAAKILDSASLTDVELSEETNPRRANDRFRVEITSHAAGKIVRVESSDSTAEAALDQAVDRFTEQLRRTKEKLVQRSRPRGHREEPADDQSEAGPEIVRTKQFVMKPMGTEEAILQMDLLGHAFFFFHNSESDLPSVLYRRRDGAYGLIEPA